MNRSKHILVGTIVCLIAITSISYLVFTSISRSGGNAINIDIVPDDASISVDGKRIKRGTNYLEPGTYEVRASRKGFENYTSTITVHPYTKSYGIILNADSTEGKEWLDKHSKSINRVEIVNDLAVKEAGKAFHDENPIAQYLPYKNFIFSIGTTIDQSDPSELSIIIVINAPEGYKQAALYKIRQLGYDPTDFTINFRDYENPFPL